MYNFYANKIYIGIGKGNPTLGDHCVLPQNNRQNFLKIMMFVMLL